MVHRFTTTIFFHVDLTSQIGSPFVRQLRHDTPPSNPQLSFESGHGLSSVANNTLLAHLYSLCCCGGTGVSQASPVPPAGRVHACVVSLQGDLLAGRLSTVM